MTTSCGTSCRWSAEVSVPGLYPRSSLNSLTTTASNRPAVAASSCRRPGRLLRRCQRSVIRMLPMADTNAFDPDAGLQSHFMTSAPQAGTSVRGLISGGACLGGGPTAWRARRSVRAAEGHAILSLRIARRRPCSLDSRMKAATTGRGRSFARSIDLGSAQASTHGCVLLVAALAGMQHYPEATPLVGSS